jgi:uncharacterized membrane protein YvbJ
MKKCPRCGEEVMEDFDTCFSCGYELEQSKKEQVRNLDITNNTDANFIFVLVAFFFPFIGLILYFLIKQSNERLASQMLTAVFVSVVFYSIMVSMMAIFFIGFF